MPKYSVYVSKREIYRGRVVVEAPNETQAALDVDEKQESGELTIDQVEWTERVQQWWDDILDGPAVEVDSCMTEQVKPTGYVCPTIPIEVLDMLSDTQMLDLHDDNGPGRVECPVCGEGISMRWKWGNRLDDPDDIVHHQFCPVAWARKSRP